MSEASPAAASAARRLAARARARDHLRGVASGEVAPDYRVGLAATFTADPVVPFLVDGLLEQGMRPQVVVAPFNQVIQSCLDPTFAFGSAPLQAVVVLWRIEDVLSRELEALGEGAAPPAADAILEQLAAALAAVRKGTGATVAASVPAAPWGPGLDLLEFRVGTRLLDFHAQVRTRWEGLLARTGALPLDVDAWQRPLGEAAVFDARTWYLYRQPYRESFLEVLGRRVADLLALTRGAPRKCLVLDCDNVLWGGIVGEEGADGVAIGGEFPGAAYLDLQRLVLRWRAEGVLLALASRNNEADVWEVFDQRSEMLLRREHLSAWRVDWNAKSSSIEAIAAELGIGLDAVVFVDDSPTEIEEVSTACPAVACILLPPDPARAVESLASARPFEHLDVTSEDVRRAQMMDDARRRGSLRARLSHAEFLQSLRLRVRAFRPDESHVARVGQLVAKTNQFNLTTRRRSGDEIRSLLRSPAHTVWAVNVDDRFGDYGLTGVAIVEYLEGEAVLDTFLLSCRVLGREVETALLSAVAAGARERGRERLRARFIPTARNQPAARFLPDHGFLPTPEGEWRAALSAVPALPSHIAMQLDGPDPSDARTSP